MQFKQLDIEPEGSWFRKTFLTSHAKKSMIFILIGVAGGLIFMLITNDKTFAEITTDEFLQSMLLGGFLGFFITNSPCARNKC